MTHRRSMFALAARLTLAALPVASAVAPVAARAQFVPDAPPFVRADPNLGRPFDQYPSGPYGDPSLSRQGPMATPHPMFRDPAKDVFTDRPAAPPTVGQGLLPLTSRRTPGAGAPLGGPPVALTQRKEAGAPGVVASLRDVGRALSRCWRPPAAAGAVEATLRLAFARDGRLVGAPRVTYVKVEDTALREAVRVSALAAARACAPLRFTPAAASAMAGRIFAIRLIAFPQGFQQDL